MIQDKLRTSDILIGLILFELGSTTLFFLGSEAKQNAWLVMLGGGAAGVLVLLLHLLIHHRDPRLDLYLLFHRYMGPWIGTLFNLGFIGYFSYETSRNLRDLGELSVMTLLPGTRLWVVMVIGLLVIANAVRYGPRVNFLTGVFLIPFLFTAYALLIGATFIAGLIHFDFLFPVLEHGITPDMGIGMLKTLAFPFGESVIFLVYYPMVQREKNFTRKTLSIYGGIVIFLMFMNELNVLILGPVLAENSTLPLLETVQLIQVPGVLERMDALFTMFLFIGLGFKMNFFYMGAVIGLERVTGFSYRKWVIPLGAAIYASAFLSPNYTHHIWLGREAVVLYIWPIFQIGLPLLLFIVMLLRRKKIKPH